MNSTTSITSVPEIMERLREIEKQLSVIEELHPNWVEEVTPEAFLAVVDIFLIFTTPANIYFSSQNGANGKKAEDNYEAFIIAFNKLLKDHCNITLPSCQ
jgi:hypothetical protein